MRGATIDGPRFAPAPPVAGLTEIKPPETEPAPGDTSPLLQPPPHPYHITQRPNATRHPVLPGPTQCPLPNTTNLAPPKPAHLPANTTENAAKTLPPAPIQPHRPPDALLELSEMNGNEREIDFSVLITTQSQGVHV